MLIPELFQGNFLENLINHPYLTGAVIGSLAGIITYLAGKHKGVVDYGPGLHKKFSEKEARNLGIFVGLASGIFVTAFLASFY